jgi:hypothetical protein
MVTPLALILSIFLAGAGHGAPYPMLMCYPAAFIFTNLQDGLLLWTILLGQFSAYGLLLDFGNWKSKVTIANGLVFLMHLGTLAAAILILNARGYWDKW